MWDTVNSAEAALAATLMGITTVYFFLTKERALFYILLPPLAAGERFLYLEKVLRRFRIVDLFLTIFLTDNSKFN